MKPVLIVEDHPLVAEATAKLLAGLSDESEVVLAGSASETLQCLNRCSWFRILLDLDVPGAYGLSLAHEVEQRQLADRCCVVSALDRPELVSFIAAHGFAGYIVKAMPVADFTSAIKKVLAEEATFPDLTASRRDPPLRLTRRQLEILQRVSLGESSRAVSRSIHISEGTVNNHMTAIMQVLQVSTRTEAVVRAIELGLLRTASSTAPARAG